MQFTPDKIEIRKIDSLKPYDRNARTHSDAQVDQLAESIREFGFTDPVLIDAEGGIIAGHGRVMAARKLGIKQVPCISLSHLSDAKKRAYVIADNRLAENAGWDSALLASEVEELLADMDGDINWEAIGFSPEDFSGLVAGESVDLDDDEPTADDYADIGQGAASGSDSAAIMFPVVLQLDKRTWQIWKNYKGSRRDSEAFTDLIALID